MQNLMFFLIAVKICLATSPFLLEKAKLKDHESYFIELLQETIYEVEGRDWSILKVVGVGQDIDEQMYDWLVRGTVNYTNGFLVSIQSIDLTGIEFLFNNNAANPEGFMRGLLNMRQVSIGYDVITNMTNAGIQHFTGVFQHTLVEFNCEILHNYTTQVTTASVRLNGLSGEGKMDYMPTSNLTQVLSRHYRGFLAWDGISTWASDTLTPILNELITTKYKFPEVCFNHC